MLGKLVTARNILDSVREGRIDIGPLDSYWHLLVARHAPELTAGIRVLAVTETAPVPAFVASAATPAEEVTRLRRAFRAAGSRAWFKPLSDILLLDGFAEASEARFGTLLEWDRSARAAGYNVPA
jgi:ABC-type phosphate/phosphonate transport system substrate-binding protein